MSPFANGSLSEKRRCGLVEGDLGATGDRVPAESSFRVPESATRPLIRRGQAPGPSNHQETQSSPLRTYQTIQ